MPSSSLYNSLKVLYTFKGKDCSRTSSYFFFVDKCCPQSTEDMLFHVDIILVTPIVIFNTTKLYSLTLYPIPAHVAATDPSSPSLHAMKLAR